MLAGIGKREFEFCLAILRKPTDDLGRYEVIAAAQFHVERLWFADSRKKGRVAYRAQAG